MLRLLTILKLLHIRLLFGFRLRIDAHLFILFASLHLVDVHGGRLGLRRDLDSRRVRCSCRLLSLLRIRLQAGLVFLEPITERLTQIIVDDVEQLVQLGLGRFILVVIDGGAGCSQAILHSLDQLVELKRLLHEGSLGGRTVTYGGQLQYLRHIGRLRQRRRREMEVDDLVELIEERVRLHRLQLLQVQQLIVDEFERRLRSRLLVLLGICVGSR